MGTAVVWEYGSDRYSTFWTDLYAKVQSVGAYAIFTTAGCPAAIELLLDDGTEGGYNANLSLLVGFVKRFFPGGLEPRLIDAGDGYAPVYNPGFSTVLYDSVAAHKGSPTGIYVGNVTTALQVASDADWLAAGGSSSSDFQFSTYKSDWSGDYSIMDNLLTGHIGYASHTEGTHPANLWDLSRVILGKAGNFQIPVAQQGSRVALVCPESLDSGHCIDGKQALIGKKLQNLGIDVRYWYPNAPTAVAEALLPVAGEDNWTTGQLDASTASPTCTFQYALGCGFENAKSATWKATMIPSTSGGLFTGGKSYGDVWGKMCMVDGGHSFITHMADDFYGYHQIARTNGKHTDIWLNLIAGRTLCEAAWSAFEYSHLALGDPLMKPFPS
jgi:hypothetical protein